MTLETFPIGQAMDVTYPDFKVSLNVRSLTEMSFEIKEGPFAHTETIAIQIVPLGNASSR